MGKSDILESDYLDDDRRFADLINGALYGGVQVVLPQELEEADGELFLVGNRAVKKTIRDKVRRWKREGVLFAVLTVENQNYVDYAMVLRSMLTEAMGYHRQWKKKKRTHEVMKDLPERDEFLSGIKKDEKFTPIVPLIVYYGIEKRWDGPRTLYELLDMQGKNRLKPYINDYRMNLFDFHERDSFQEFKTELQTLFEVLRYVRDEKTMDIIFHENEERFSGVDSETVQLLSELAGNIDWEKYRIQTQDQDKGGEKINMMKAWEDHKLKGKFLGEQTKLISQVCKKMKKGSSVQEIAEMLEEDEAEIERICQAAETVVPKFDIDAIVAKLFPTIV